MTAPSRYFVTPELYDLMYAGFVTDVGVVVDEARAAEGAVLEVACGSGRLLVPLLEAGVDADGLDYDPAMLDSLRTKLALRGLTTGVHEADMRDFSRPRKYALVVIGFNSFLHNLTQEDQIRTLRRCREHLAPGGHLVLMLFHPSARKLLSFDGSPALSIEVALEDGARIRVLDAITANRVTQINEVRRRYERLDADARVVETHDFAFELRYVYTPEMALLLRTAGFTRMEVCSPFEKWNGERFIPPKPPQDGGVHLWRAWAETA